MENVLRFLTFLILLRAQVVLGGCCTIKVVDSGIGDERDGTYYFSGTRTNLPLVCGDECVYTKDNSSQGSTTTTTNPGTTTTDPGTTGTTTPTDEELFCFGTGDLDSTCFAPVTDPPPPQLLPGAGGGDGDVAPPGEYYPNTLPGTNTASLQCGEKFSVLSEDRMSRMDLNLQSDLVDNDASALNLRKLRFERIDGESTGEVQYDHLVGVFETLSSGAVLRLNILDPATVSTDTGTTRITVKSADGSSCSGSVVYGQEYGLFSEDGLYMLDIDVDGTDAELTYWDEATSNTRFHLNNLAL